MKKYEFTGQTCELHGHTLLRIRAVRDFGNVKAGDRGGWIESEDNLSHDGNAWVANEAKVMNRAQVKDNALVTLYAQVGDYAVVQNNAEVKKNATVSGHVLIAGEATVSGNATVQDRAIIQGQALICKDVTINGHAVIRDFANIRDHVTIGGNAIIGGTVVLANDVYITDYATVLEQRDVFWVTCITSAIETFTAYRCADGQWRVHTQFFRGTLDALAENPYMKEYRLAVELAKTHIRCA